MASPQLVGRDNELATLASTLADGGAAVVQGEAGLGKTSLIRAAAVAHAEAVFEGTGLATLSFTSYLPITRALGERPIDGDPAAVAQFVVDRVGSGVLVLDDVHWADPETVALLPLLRGRVKLLAALRTGEPISLARLEEVTAAGVSTLPLSPLSAEDSERLLRARNRELDPRRAREVIDAAGGNPFLLEELSAEGQSAEMLRISLGARLQRLSPGGTLTLARLALLGRPAAPSLARGNWQESVAAGFARRDRQMLTLRHALVGEGVLELFDADGVRELHSELAARLSDPGEAARHHELAGEGAKAHECALAAARATAHPEERARHLAIAASHVSGGAADALRLEAAEALSKTGHHRDVIRLLDEIEADDALTRARAGYLLADAHFRIDAPERADEIAAEALTLVPEGHAELEVSILAIRASCRLWDWDGPGSIALARRALDKVGGNLESQAEAELVLGQAMYVNQNPACVEQLERALEVARATGDAVREAQAGQPLIAGAYAWGQVERARALGAELGGRARVANLRRFELGFRMAVVFMAAQLEPDRTAVIAECHELLRDVTVLGQDVHRLRSALATAFAWGGEDVPARAVTDEGLRLAATSDGRAALLWAKAEVDWLAGRLGEAIEAADECAGLASAYGTMALAVRPWAVRESGRGDAVPGPGSQPYPVDAGADTELLAHAQLAERGAAEAAERLFDRAAQEWHGVSLFYEARCLWGAGIAARKAGALDRARERLLAAEEFCARMALPPLVGRIRQALRQLGEVRQAASSGRVAHDELTARERAVLEGVARGQTSREIGAALGTAPGTVDSQIKSAMRKLGARTRAQAAATAGFDHSS